MEISIREKKHFALTGFPLGHSISPFIHTELQKSAGIVASYDCIEVKKENLEKDFFEKLVKLDGFNVTIPHKTDIIPFLDGLSSRAEIFGAVNTVDIKDGKTTGHNTDCIGFARALGAAQMDICGDVLILGSGGVSRVFAYESAIAGADITLAVRQSGVQKARALKDEIKRKLNRDASIVFLDGIPDKKYNLIINGTPVGMFPNTGECPVSESTVKNADAVFDAIYNPCETMLLKYAKKHGVNCSNGLSMLVWQAAAAEEIWNDVDFEDEQIEEITKLSKEFLENG